MTNGVVDALWHRCCDGVAAVCGEHMAMRNLTFAGVKWIDVNVTDGKSS